MKYTGKKEQPNLFQFGLMQIKIPENHPLVQMAKEINWDDLTDIVGKNYSKNNGAPSNSLRMMMGLEIAKRRYGYSDEELIKQLEVDVALQYFCGFTGWLEEKIPDSSSMTKFRNKLDKETLELLEESSLKKFIRKVPAKKRHHVVSDTTCIPANITYPTDTKLLSRAYNKLVKGAEMLRGKGVKIVIRGKRTIKKIIKKFNLKRKKTQAKVKEIKELLLKESQKLLEVLKTKEKVITDILTSIALESLKGKVLAILTQQEEMLREGTNRIKGRIVSFHEQGIRPIFRGKEKAKTEFGNKITINVIGGCLAQTGHMDHDNYTDTKIPEQAIAMHNKTFGRDPSELIVDRGGHSPGNHDLLKEKGITDGIQYRGKIPEKATLPKDRTIKRLYKQRSVVEGKIGTHKTKYGAEKNIYKDDNARCFVTFGFLAMNARWAATH